MVGCNMCMCNGECDAACIIEYKAHGNSSGWSRLASEGMITGLWRLACWAKQFGLGNPQVRLAPSPLHLHG